MTSDTIHPGGFDGYRGGQPLLPITVDGNSDSIEWLKCRLRSSVQQRRIASWAAGQLAIAADLVRERGYSDVAEFVSRIRRELLPTSDASQAKIVCLVGSSRFYDAFMRASYELELAGEIVVGPGFCPDVGADQHGGDVGITPEQKRAVDALYKQKIALADEVYVLNVGGYIGTSTREDITFAVRLGKPVRWLEAPNEMSAVGS